MLEGEVTKIDLLNQFHSTIRFNCKVTISRGLSPIPRRNSTCCNCISWGNGKRVSIMIQMSLKIECWPASSCTWRNLNRREHIFLWDKQTTKKGNMGYKRSIPRKTIKERQILKKMDKEISSFLPPHSPILALALSASPHPWSSKLSYRVMRLRRLWELLCFRLHLAWSIHDMHRELLRHEGKTLEKAIAFSSLLLLYGL